MPNPMTGAGYGKDKPKPPAKPKPGRSKKAGNVLAYTKGVSEADKQKTKDYYYGEYKKIKKEADKVGANDPFTMLGGMGDSKKTKQREAASLKQSRYRASIDRRIADQNRWINRGAKANEVAIAKLNANKAKKSALKKKMVNYGSTQVPEGDPFDKSQKRLFKLQEKINNRYGPN